MIHSSHSQILIEINVHIIMTKDMQAYLNIQTPHIITQFADSRPILQNVSISKTVLMQISIQYVWWLLFLGCFNNTSNYSTIKNGKFRSSNIKTQLKEMGWEDVKQIVLTQNWSSDRSLRAQ